MKHSGIASSVVRRRRQLVISSYTCCTVTCEMNMTRQQTIWKKTHTGSRKHISLHWKIHHIHQHTEEWDNHWNFLPLDLFKDLQGSFIQVFVGKVKGKFMKWKCKTRTQLQPRKTHNHRKIIHWKRNIFSWNCHVRGNLENHPLEKRKLIWTESTSFFGVPAVSFYWRVQTLGQKICRFFRSQKTEVGIGGFEVMGSDGCWPYWPIAMKWCPFSCNFLDVVRHS